MIAIIAYFPQANCAEKRTLAWQNIQKLPQDMQKTILSFCMSNPIISASLLDDTPELIKTDQECREMLNGEQPHAITFTADGQHIVLQSANNLMLLNINNSASLRFKKLPELQVAVHPSKPLLALSYQPEKDASAEKKTIIFVCDYKKKNARTIELPSKEVFSMSFKPNAEILAVSYGTQLAFFDLEKSENNLKEISGPLYCNNMYYSRNGNQLICINAGHVGAMQITYDLITESFEPEETMIEDGYKLKTRMGNLYIATLGKMAQLSHDDQVWTTAPFFADTRNSLNVFATCSNSPLNQFNQNQSIIDFAMNPHATAVATYCREGLTIRRKKNTTLEAFLIDAKNQAHLECLYDVVDLLRQEKRIAKKCKIVSLFDATHQKSIDACDDENIRANYQEQLRRFAEAKKTVIGPLLTKLLEMC